MNRRAGGVRDLVTVQGALAGWAHREVPVGPDVAGVELGVGLQNRHPPTVLAVVDGPVQRRRPPVAADAGVDDQAGSSGPYRFGYGPLQVRRDHQIRPGVVEGGLHLRLVGHSPNGDVVAGVFEIHQNALRETVDPAGHQQHAHRARLPAAIHGHHLSVPSLDLLSK